jgi:hypothetical protein
MMVVMNAPPALGFSLHLLPPDKGGRQIVLDGTQRFGYRPNWGLPGMVAPEQTGAPVLCFSQDQIAPGQRIRVVIVPPFPELWPAWNTVDVGAVLPLYEGARVCAVGAVLWTSPITQPLSPSDEDRFVAWVRSNRDRV